MPDELPHAIETLRRPLWASVATNLTLVVTILGVSVGAVRGFSTGVTWINTQSNLIAANGAALKDESDKIAGLHLDIVSLDKRVNELQSRVIDLHTQSDQADAALKARLDVIDALAKFNTDRTFQAPLPQGPRR